MAKKFYCYLFKVKSNRVLLGLCIGVFAFVAASCNNSAKKNSQMAAVGLLSHYMKEYTAGFESWVNEFGTRSDMLMFQEVVGSVVWESDKALTYCITFENFMGGAHGGHLQSARTFRKTDGKVIQLIDSTQLDKMQALMYEGLKDYLGQEITPNFNVKVSDMLFVKRIPLPADHLVMQQNGLFFLYQPYEIAAYVYGMPSFTNICLVAQWRTQLKTSHHFCYQTNGERLRNSFDTIL